MTETMTERNRDIHRGEPPDELIETTAMQTRGPGQELSILDLPAEQFKAGLTRRGDNRRLLFEWLKANMVRNVDFGAIHVVSKAKCQAGNQCNNPAHFSKDTLFQPGAEKVCGMLGIRITFPNFQEYEKAALAGVKIQTVVIRCELVSSTGAIVGEGIGARNLEQDYGDLNKCLKMASKSAFIMATIKTGGMSELFTLDLDDMYPDGKPTAQKPPQSVDVRGIALGEKPAPSNVYTEHAGTQQNASQSKGAAPAKGDKPPASLTCPKCGERKCGRSQYAPDDGDHPANPDGSPNYCYRRFYCYACKGKFPTDDPELCDQEAGIGNEGPVNQAPPTDKAVVDKHEAAINLTTSLDNLTTFWELVNADWRQGKLTRKGMDHLKEVAAERKRWLANQPPVDADGNYPY